MRTSLTTRLFLALLLACTVVMLFQASAVRESFHNGLLRHLEEDAAKSLAIMQPEVEARYALAGSWNFLREENAWSDLVTMRIQTDSQTIERADELGALVRIGLIDTDRKVLAGNPRAANSPIHVPVKYQGNTVGHLAIVPLSDVMAPGLRELMSQLWRKWWLYLGVSLLTVAIATHLLIKPIRARLRALGDATRVMAQGAYATRVEVGTTDEFGELARDFNRMAQSLESNERSRRQFLADVSHELKTPLAVIQAEVESMQDGVRRGPADSLGNIATQVAALGKAIDDLYDVALTDIGAHAYRFEQLDIGALLTEAFEEYQAAFAARGLRLTYEGPDEPLHVNGDPARLAQMLGHLLENSLHFTDPPGEVAIRCVRALRAVLIVIEDDPPGVEIAEIERMFDRFYRASCSRSREGSGKGLGLAICRNVVEAHAGRISAAHSASGGVRISIALPAEGA